MPQAIDDGSAGSGQALAKVVDGLQSGISGRDDDRVCVAEIVQSLNDRGFGVLCAVIGALAALPIIGGLPGVSVGAALLVLLVAGQHVVGRDSLWIPSVLGRRSFKREMLEKGLGAVWPYARWVDKLVEPRLKWLIGGDRERRLIAAAICVLALTMLPLALIPWGVFAPALAITAFGIAFTGRDGVLALIGYVLAALTIYVLFAFSDAILSLL